MIGEQLQPVMDDLAARDTAVPRLTGNWLRAARVGWWILAVTAVLILIASLPGYALKLGGQLSHSSPATRTIGVVIFAALSGVSSLAAALLSLGLAFVFFRRRFQEPAAAALAFFLLIYGVVLAGPLEALSAYWTGDVALAQTLQGVLLVTPMMALFVLFPDGRFVPAWTRWALLLTIPWNITLFFLPGFGDDSLTNLPPAQMGLLLLWYASFLLIGLYAQVYRYRRVSAPAERQQTKWVLFGFAVWIAYGMVSAWPYFYLLDLPPGAPLPWWAPATELGWFLSLAVIPATLAIAVTRSRLWQIDIIINRTLVYGALTAVVVGIYMLIVGASGALAQAQGSWPVALLATGLVAVLFQPLRERLQRGVNRLIYGERDDPVAVFTKLGERLATAVAPDEMLPILARTVGRTLKLPYVAVTRQTDGAPEIAAAYGKPAANLVHLPLTYQGQTIGELQVASRQTGEAFNPAEMALLQNIARQAGTAVHAAQLTADLRRSRQRLVTAREEERRRLRRDLHDDLGPKLASLTLSLNAIGKLMEQDPAAAAELLAELKEQAGTAVQDIRRLVYDLRPPALDDLGLAAALRESASSYRSSGVQFTIHVPQPLPALPAAVEVAAYRIAQEGMTNAVRHAAAAACRVTLALELGALCLTIIDDGCGLPADLQPGIGLRSMRERVAELDGRFALESHPGGGTTVKATLPLPAAVIREP